jgi:hypothetical protein
LGDFMRSQQNNTVMANYNYSCFGNYTITDPTSGKDFDGAIFQ